VWDFKHSHSPLPSATLTQSGGQERVGVRGEQEEEEESYEEIRKGEA